MKQSSSNAAFDTNNNDIIYEHIMCVCVFVLNVTFLFILSIYTEKHTPIKYLMSDPVFKMAVINMMLTCYVLSNFLLHIYI